MKNVDLVYRNHGMFTRFIPMSTAGEQAWRELAISYESTPEAFRPCAGDVYSMHLKAVLKELRKVGYVVRIGSKVSNVINTLTAEDLELLDKLSA